MQLKHRNIPIFLPELACPHQCVFCNQSHISGQKGIPSVEEVVEIIERNLETIPSDYTVQIAYFGGSFTGLSIELQEKYLQIAQPYIVSGKIQGIRLSTRPDYISEKIIETLIKYGVQEIELGAQSCHDDVLRISGRGHSFEDIRAACELILSKKLRLGLQMMIGLPGDTFEKSLHTAKIIISLGAHSTRIYPTLVIKNTSLADLYAQGKYKPLSLDEAVRWTKELYLLFEQNNVKVLRTGLHPSEDLMNPEFLLAGPFHASFKELVMTKIWNDIFSNTLPKKKGSVIIQIPPNQLNFAIGYQSSNRNMLQETFGNVQFKGDNTLHNYEFTYSYH
jgi:histone acetyltransferase (RNA polymerase elongator complex component)